MGGTSHKFECTYRIYSLDAMGGHDALVKTVHTFSGFINFWKNTGLGAVLIEKTTCVKEIKTSKDGKTVPGLVAEKKPKTIGIRCGKGPLGFTDVDRDLYNKSGKIPANISGFFGVNNDKER